MSLVEKLFGSFSDRELKKINPIAKQVLALEEKYAAMPDADLQAQTAVFKQQLADGKTTDDILPDAFAVCREAAWRVLGMKHFPVQVIGGIALHRGDISEMQTGEGKTLVATLPAYLNALTGEGVHVVTVNDYLAKRDSEWMGKLYRWLGLSVGLIAQGMDGDARRAAYAADITYGTNNEFGFDYLRDNMVTYKANMVQRGHAYAIVDEVDSILIDEARTPLIISGRGEDSSSLYTQVDRFVRTLRKSVVVELEDKVSTDEQTDGDYVVDEKHKTCTLTASGIKKAEAYFKVENLAAAENMTLAHHIDQAIKAYGVMQRDIDYVVKDGQVIIVDEFTGRLMIGRRYNEGLHQAIEAKEGVKIAAESKTLATITFQNYFRMYKKLSGMTGTAQTEATEFEQIYKLDVVEIPTNRPMIRKDLADSVYKTEKGKFHAVIDQIEECHEREQPVLVGTNRSEGNFQAAFTWLDPAKYAPTLLRRLTPARRAALLAQYPALPDKGAFGELLTDVMYAFPKLRFAERLSRGGNPVYVYRFDYYTEALEKMGLYACHVSELLPLFEFQTGPYQPLMAGSEEEVHGIGTRMRRYWGAFAWTGVPQVEGQAEWKPYTEQARHTLVIDREDQLELDPEEEIRRRYEDLDRVLI